MLLKGFNKFREKLPVLGGLKILIIPIYILYIVLALFYVLDQFYSYPENLIGMNTSNLGLFIPIIGVILAEIVGFYLLSRMWIWRDRLKRDYGSSAYQRIFFVSLPGIVIIICLAFNIFISFQNYAPDFWRVNKNFILITPLSILFEGQIKEFLSTLQMILGLIFLLFGLGMSLRSIITFGIDYTTAIYIYFPEESTVQENQIYSVLRHPMYGGLILIAFGGFAYYLTLYSFIFFLSYIIGFYIHIHFVEEPELISRFGKSYEEYRKNVPPFILNPKRFSALMKFIIRGN